MTKTAELALIFLRLGLTAFGGPAAHIALMRQEFVERRGWLTEAEFLDLLGASHLIPGPSSTEMAIHIGWRRAGGFGLVLAGTCFFLPAALMVCAFAWAYVRFGRLPQVAGALHGVEAVIVAVVAQALWALGRTAWKSRPLALLGIAATALAAIGIGPLPVLFGAGLVTGVTQWASAGRIGGVRPVLILGTVTTAFLAVPALLARAAQHDTAFGLLSLLLVFLKLGATVFGSGYVLLAYLRDDLVTRLHWLTSQQLLDAVAVGQVTPGPVFTTATFIGYLKAGPAGALVATLGIFLPGFVFVAAGGPLLPRLRRAPMTSAFLDGVNAAAVALMVVVTWQLARAVLTDWAMFGATLVSLFLLLRFHINSAWLVLGGALLGLMLPVHRT
jgi:chromate transporter